MEDLVNDLNAGKVKALLMYNVNPVYDYPESEKFLEGAKKDRTDCKYDGYAE